MFSSVARDLSRRVFVAARRARTAALHLGYAAYQMSLRRPAPSTREAIAGLQRRLIALFEQDWADAESGLYPRQLIDGLPWREYAEALPKLLVDLPRTRKRVLNGKHEDLDDAATPERYPRYYRRNFHWQTDGYLGHRSAELYDLQVELLFGGTADVMRRRLIPPLVRHAADVGHSRTRPLKILDVGCGTGHFLRMLGSALPDAQVVGVDLSPHYVARARSLMPREMNVSLLVENAEALPFVDSHFDAATCVFMFHELPAEVRARVLAEMARVVRPGGIVVLADSLQLHDAPELQRELLAFPENFHEPYYLSYLQDDLAARMNDAGLRVVEEKPHFLTKVVVAARPV